MQTEIPEDVMKAAAEAHSEFAKSSVRDNLTTIIARAIMAERERDKWQPIKTAPQDGSKLLFIEESGRIQVGRMDAEWGGEKSVFVCLTGGVGDWYPSIRPTHWMPLPAPPKQEA